MKKPILFPVLIVILSFVILGLYLLNSCQKDVEAIPFDFSPKFSGVVVNDETNFPIQGATVTFAGKRTHTNESGIFYFYEELSDGDIIIEKENYVTVRRSLVVDGTETDEERIFFFSVFPQRQAHTVNHETENTIEESSDQGTYTLTVPANALSSDESICVTPVMGGGIPVMLETEDLVVVAVDLAPHGLEFSQSVELRVPIGDLENTTNLHVYLVNNETGAREEITDFIVLSDEKVLQIPLNHFSTLVTTSGDYRLASTGSYVEGPFDTGSIAGCTSSGTSTSVSISIGWNIPANISSFAAATIGVNPGFSISSTGYCIRSQSNSPQLEVVYTISGIEYRFQEWSPSLSDWVGIGTVRKPIGIVWECKNVGACHSGGSGQ
jgi:hypothetical protein